MSPATRANPRNVTGRVARLPSPNSRRTAPATAAPPAGRGGRRRLSARRATCDRRRCRCQRPARPDSAALDPARARPSTIVRIPASRARRQISATGKVSAVGLVMWLMKMMRVLGDAGPETLDEIGVRCDGQGDRPLDITDTDLVADVAPGPIHGTVFVVGGQDFVAGAQSQGRLAASGAEACGRSAFLYASRATLRATMLIAVVGLGK